MLIFVSDLHLRPGATSHISRAAQFARFWQRIDASRRDNVAQLCFVGDLLDLVRSPAWQGGKLRPYHEPGPALAAAVDGMVRDTVEAERPFFAATRGKGESGALEVHSGVGNHDRLLHHAPAARARLRAALGMPGGDAPLPAELVFPRHGVLAYHGHVVDHLCHDPSGAPPLSDLIAAELIVPFPEAIRKNLSLDDPHLDDIDDVRPIVAVPTWVRTLARSEEKRLGNQVANVWAGLVESFLGNATVKDWFKENHKALRFDFAQKVKLLLTLSAKRGHKEDGKLEELYYVFFKLFDGRFAKSALKELEKREHEGLRFVVNGHTHFAGMKPLGLVSGKPACYFNVGTWRPVHQLGHVRKGQPAFLAYDAMAYLVFFDPGDPLGRDFEWWQGAATSLA